ncbi:MAG TPA: DUF1501 domain-containing protein [Planctomycetaceae bacterium]|nr:DUF1501 domain-containing protein [Planctomycetaceae bacterium]
MSISMNRRELLRRTGGGFGALALTALLAEESLRGETRGAPQKQSADTDNPLAAKPPDFPARAKRVIFLFMPGGPSQVDTFDPKPRLTRDDGRPSPKLYLGQRRNLMASPWKFGRHGESGIDVSTLFPHTARCVDDLCLIRSMVTDDSNHPGGCLLMNTGERVFSRPSLGAWVTYGLGTENRNLPGFVAIGPGPIIEGARQYGSSFLPAAYQGTFVSNLNQPLKNLRNPQVGRVQQRRDLDTLARLNALHLATRGEDSRLSARIESFELAYRMQSEAPEAFDLTGETPATAKAYGLDQPANQVFGRQCLLARRLVERGVRFVQLYHTTGGFQPWDQHSDLKGGHERNALATDRPIAGLLQDLKQRGLLNDTLVIWGGEFGRTPACEGKADGRDHHPFGFTMWLAGGGVRGGSVYGATDEFGWDAVENRVHVHDLHATILHLLGLDHEQLTYRFAGRDFRLTDVYGQVVEGVLA